MARGRPGEPKVRDKGCRNIKMVVAVLGGAVY